MSRENFIKPALYMVSSGLHLQMQNEMHGRMNWKIVSFSGIHVLRILKYDRQTLAMRRLQCESVDADPIVWTNQRFIRWARSIDLGEYADNLKGMQELKLKLKKLNFFNLKFQIVAYTVVLSF